MAGDSSSEGQVSLGPLTIYFPDASLDTFWFMHDLTDILGVEYNSEAQARLEGALRGKRRGLDLDHEADCVVVHASGVKALTTALVALDSVAVARPLWSEEAFDRAVEAMSVWRRPRPLPYDPGAVVAVPLKEVDSRGRFGAALVATFESALWADPPKRRSERGSPLLWVFDLTAPSAAALRDRLTAGEGKPMGCAVVLDREIVTGEWPVIAHREVPTALALAALEHERGSSSSGHTVLALAMRYAGLWAWDFGNPEYAEKHLLPGEMPPPERRYLRELLEARLTTAFGRVPDSVREGPAVLHVHIAYPGNGLPRIIDVPKAPRLEKLMKEAVPGIGEVFTGGGGGFLDVIARTTDTRVALQEIERALAELRLTKEALVDSYPEVSIEDLHVVERAFPRRG
jgi:hypothetical protein